MEVNPLEVDIRSEKADYAHGKFKLDKMNGRRVERQHYEAEPVNVTIDGNKAFRMFITSSEALSFRYTLDNVTRAKLSLYDARQVLRRGTIEQYFGDVSLGNVVEYIMENRDDPHNVITDYEFVGSTEAGETRETITEVSRTTGFAVGEASLGRAQSFAQEEGSLLDKITAMTEFADQYHAGFDFNGVSPLEAMQEVANEFGFDWRVDPNGVLKIGRFGGYGTVTPVSENNDNVILHRYDITSAADLTDTVRIRGPYNLLSYTNQDVGRLRPVVEAQASGIDGSALELEPKNAVELETLRDSAVRLLLDELMNSASGSMEINGLASEDTGRLAELQPGHHILVDERIPDHCEEEVIAGHFLVKRVHHKASTTQGWDIRLDVALSIPADALTVESFIYDPTTDQRFEDLESYNEWRGTEEQPATGNLGI